MNRNVLRSVPVLFVVAALLGCNTAPKSEASKDDLVSDGNAALTGMKSADSGLESFMKGAYGYAIFPGVGKGGLIVGGAYGRAAVYEQGKMIGYADMTQANIGLQAGGQKFRELIIFADKATMDRFKASQLAFDANLSAVALKTGAASSANYKNGVVVFVQPIGGLMFEMNVGGQQFTFQPK